MAVWLHPRFHHLPEQASFTEVKTGAAGVLLVQRDVTDSCLTVLSVD